MNTYKDQLLSVLETVQTASTILHNMDCFKADKASLVFSALRDLVKSGKVDETFASFTNGKHCYYYQVKKS